MNQTSPLYSPADRKPLVATLSITPAAQEYFNQLRSQHFPPDRNYLHAHLTLFHALPNEPWIFEELKELAALSKPFSATAQAIVSLGRGTAFKIVSAELPTLHQTLQKRWSEHLTNQDRQKRNFHITIQNKVEPEVAKQLQAALIPTFETFSFEVTGIQLWRYLGGPWEYLVTFGFGDVKSLF